MTSNLPGDDGSAPVVELAFGAPLIVAVVWLLIWAGSATQTPSEVTLAAQDAARIGSTLRQAADRPAMARSLVDDRLADSACSSWSTTVSSTPASVTVTVNCVLDTPQMAGLDVPARTVAATGRASIDRFFVQDSAP